MEKKKSHKKLLISGLALLSCALIAGVGYAAWVVAASITEDEGNVTVHAPDVLEEAITFSVTNPTDKYIFGPSGTGTYITTDNAEGDTESLSVSFTFNVVASGLGKDYNITLSLAGTKMVSSSGGTAEESGSDVTALSYAISQDYLVAPISSEVVIATIDADDNSVTANNTYANDPDGAGIKVSATANQSSGYDVTVTANFAWGSFFNSQNPVNWAPATENNESGETGASGWSTKTATINALKWMDSYLEGDTFVYTIGAE